MPGLILLLAGLAAARDVILYQGDPRPALGVADGAIPGSTTLLPVRPAEIPGADRPTVLGASTRFCRGEAGNAAIREQVSRAEGHLAYQRTAEARVVLDAAAAQLECLPEPIEASLAGRLFFLRGIVALREGDAAGAARVFRLAGLFQPGMPWDDHFPPDPTGTFTRALAPQPATVGVPVGLGPGSSTWVDGRAPAAGPALQLTPGAHYVQVVDNGRAHTVVLEVAADRPVALLTPGWLATVDLAAADDAARRTLAEVARAAFPGDTLYAVAAGRLWRVDTVWKAVPGAVSRSPRCAAPRRCVGQVLLGGGVGLVAGGAGALALAQLRVSALAASPDGETVEAYQARVGAQDEAARWLPVGGVIAGVGVVAAGVGLVLELPGTPGLAWTGTGIRAAWAF